MKRNIIRIMSLLFGALISQHSIIIAQDDLLNSAVDIHLIKGFKTWNNDVKEYKFKTTKNENNLITSFPIDSIENTLGVGILENWNIEYSIFESKGMGELAIVEQLELSSLYMNNIIDLPLVNGNIGDNCWYQPNIGTFCFLRNNVLVLIAPKYRDSTYKYSVGEKIAREVDALLIKSKKITDSKLIKSPKIISVDLVSEKPNNWDAIMTIRAIKPEQESQKTYIRIYGSGLGLISTTEYLTFPFDQNPNTSSEKPENVIFKIWIWNDDHIFSLIEKEIIF